MREERTSGLREDKTPGLKEERTPGMKEKRGLKKLSCGCLVNERGAKVKLCDLHDYVKEALASKKLLTG